MVESLTGYIARLAEAHCVSTAILFARELAPTINKSYLMCGGPRGRDYGLSLRTTIRLNVRRLNGNGSFAVDMVTALEALTLRRNLRFLTMLPWKAVLAKTHLLRTKRAWCPHCYEEWRRKDLPVYEPLLWVLSAVKVCFNHQKPLVNKCPSCKKEMLPLARQSRPGFCARCGFWLGSIDTGRESLPNKDLERNTWTAKSIGELLGTTPYLGKEVTKGRIAKAISACAVQVTGGNMAALGRLIRKQKNVLWGWHKGGLRISINDLLQICHRIHITPLEFLTAKEIVVDPAIATEAVRCDVLPVNNQARYKKTFNEDETRRRMEVILAEDPPISMKEASRRIGHSDRYLYICFPELCRAISARYIAYKKDFYKQEQSKRRDEIRRAVFQLHADGIYPSLSRIAPFLEKPGGLYSDFADGVLRELRQELGLRRQK
jgi:hypothetical protein